MRTVDLTTIMGGSAAVAEFSSIDWHLLATGDATQIGHLAKAIIFAIWGWYTNRKGTVGNTTPSGTPMSSAAPVAEGIKKDGP